MMNEDGSYPILQEYPLDSNFLELIPARAQRGLSTFDLEFTCLDADGSYIAVGSNVGVVYLIKREIGYIHKLKDHDHKSAISCVKVLISLECLVAVGYKDGAVLVYKVPFRESEELEKFTVEGLHSSSITALEWAKNGMKFFSGDENGVVVCTEIDHLEHQSRSRILMNEKSKIVQLSYSHLTLVISTLLRSLIYSLKTNAINQIGQKERKCLGPFGAIFFEDEQNCAVFASRPGQRLWKSDTSGIIQETLIFKSVLSQSQPSIQVLAKLDENICFADFQFERLARYDSYILVWCDSFITLIDPNQKIIFAVSPKMEPIVDVTTCGKEIFILRGIRHIVRISSEPDSYSSIKAEKIEEPSILDDFLVPFKGLSTYVKERSDSLSVQSENNQTIFNWLKKKRSASSPADFSEDAIEHNITETPSNAAQPLPEIVNLNLGDYTPIRIDSILPTVIKTPELLTKDFSKGNECDDIVYKVKKKHKKHKKVQFAIDAAPKREKHKFKSSSDPKKKSINEFTKNVDSSKVLVNNETNSQSSICDVPNDGQDINSASNEPILNTSESINRDSNKDVTVIYDQTIIKSSEKTGVDTDKLLENVLSVYSHLKHQDDSIYTGNISTKSLMESYSQNETNEYSSEDCSKCIDECDRSTHNLNETSLTENMNIQENQGIDEDEVYSFHEPTQTEGVKERQSPEELMEESLSLEDSSVSSSDTRSNDPPKYGVDWVEYKTPELLLDVSVSSDHIFCVDVRNKLYFTKHPQLGSLHWIELEQPAEKVAASYLETVTWVLYNGTIYAAAHKALSLWENTEWISIARDVVSIAVDDDCGWYTKSNGELVTQQNLSLTKPSNYPETVPCSSPALQVAVKDNVLWVLTISGTLLARQVFGGKNSTSVWKEIVLKDVPGIDSMFLGSKKTGWIIDSNGMIRFIIGITPETPGGTGEPWLVEASNYLFRPTTQLEQVVRRALNTEALTNLIRGKQHLRLSTSDTGIWFCKTYDNLLYSNQNSIIGHMWELIIPPSTAAATKWSLITAEGINDSEGAVWCVSSVGELFCYCIKSQNLVPIELPSTSGISCLQSKFQSLWLLTKEGDIYIRRGITPNCVQGIWWQALNLLQFGSQKIIHISCSSFVSWACTADGEIYMRLGTLSPSSSKLNQAWLSIGSVNEDTVSPLVKLSAIGKHFPLPLIPTRFSEEIFNKVYVGPLGYPVWVVDSKQNVYVREGVTTNLPIGEKWTSIPDLRANDLCISSNAVWLLKSSGKIYRRFGVTEKNPCGDYWKQIPGRLDYLSVTEDDDLWGLQNDSMFCHYSFVLYNTVNTFQKRSVERMISEDDWEDIMADEFAEND